MLGFISMVVKAEIYVIFTFDYLIFLTGYKICYFYFHRHDDEGNVFEKA